MTVDRRLLMSPLVVVLAGMLSSAACGDDSEETGECVGSPRACFLFGPARCRDQEGCDYDVQAGECEGSADRCSTFDGLDACEDQEGCEWTGS